MMKIIVIALLLSGVIAGDAQTRKRPIRNAPKTPAAVTLGVNKGAVSGRSFTSKTFHFQITFPDTWLVPDDNFDSFMKKRGVQVSYPPPSLLTAYRSMPDTADAIVRISTEDLTGSPQIRDAVDYLDVIVAKFGAAKLPAGFKYSDTRAEKLGAQQFGFIDVMAAEGKKRLYAIVRNGYAVLFTLTYTKDEDLATFRSVLENGNFSLK